MRKALTLFAAVLALPVQSSFALVGGPWDFNDHQGNSTGTYQAIITMKNGSGICRFTEGPEAQISVFNVSSIFYKGVIYWGSCFAVVDKINKKVTGMTNGSADQFQNTVSTEVSTTGQGAAAQGTIQNQSGSGAAGVIGTCNTSWSGKVTSTAPIIEFKADGIAYFFGDLDQSITSTTVVTNNRVVNPDIVQAISDIANALTGGAVISAFQNVSIDELIRLLDLSTSLGESSISNTVSSGGQSHVFPNLGVKTKIWVYGNQISYGRNPPITNAQDGLTGTGSGGFLF